MGFPVPVALSSTKVSSGELSTRLLHGYIGASETIKTHQALSDIETNPLRQGGYCGAKVGGAGLATHIGFPGI